MRNLVAGAVILFAVLGAAGIALTALSSSLAQGSQQMILANIGSAIFAAGLAFFLVEMFQWRRERDCRCR